MTTTPTVVSHVTVPSTDLAVAEEFYVGLLGFRVVSRVDAARRAAMGWSDTDAARAADHIGLACGDRADRADRAGGSDGGDGDHGGDRGVRLELFEYPQGVPAAAAPKHPHIGIDVAPEEFDAWAARLREHGVEVDGPRRLGPPDQASLYFDDPSGNHLELHTTGVDTDGMPLGGPRRSLSYRWRGLVAREESA